MAKSKKVFAVHPGEILKTEFMEPMGVSAYARAKALGFPGIYEVVQTARSAPTPRFAWGSTLACRPSSGSIFRTTMI